MEQTEGNIHHLYSFKILFMKEKLLMTIQVLRTNIDKEILAIHALKNELVENCEYDKSLSVNEIENSLMSLQRDLIYLIKEQTENSN